VSRRGERSELAPSAAAWDIRSATEHDIDPVLALWVAAGAQPSVSDTRAGLSGLLAVERDALLVAESGDGFLGSLIAAWDGWRGGFYRLVVRPDRRRLGLATALLHEGERRLSARGAIRLTALVAHDDRAAMAFWRAAGYDQQLERTRFIRAVEE
jgi:ribosomal protein S18 acetylase RimI-like enzyme